MSRYISFRDFDWVLLLLVLVICALGVVEIYSATLNTKFMGVHVKQMYWILAGVVLMFMVSFFNYQVLLERVPLLYLISIVSLLAVELFGKKYLGARRWVQIRLVSLPAIGVGETGTDSGDGEVFRRCQVGMHCSRHREGGRDGRRSHADGAGAARSRHRADLRPDRRHGAVPGRDAS